MQPIDPHAATPHASNFKLVIFDCDGVLVDSERIMNRISVEMLNELGLTVTFDDMREHFIGRSPAQGMELVARWLGGPPPPDFHETRRARTHAALESQLAAIPGIGEALNLISLPICVASNSDHAWIRKTLGITGLLSRFEGRLFSAADVAHGKPAPDVYLHAARSMGVAPQHCAVVEDTPTGVCAGVAAGMTVFGYAGLFPAEHLLRAGARRTFSDMRELPALVTNPRAVA